MADTETSTADAEVAKGPGLFARIIGIPYSPRETYAAVAARPRGLGVLAVTLAVSIACQAWFISTEVGQRALLAQQVRAMESFGVTVSDQMYAQMEQGIANAVYVTAISQAIFGPLVTALIAGLLLVVFTMLLGGAATFRHVFAVVAHSGVIVTLQQLFMTPLSYVSGDIASASLSVFVPMLDERSFVTLLLGPIDLFVVWWLVSLAIGLGVLYKRKTGPIAATFLCLYALIALALAVVRS